MTLLVLGANGQVGSSLRQRVSEAVFWTRDDLDLADTANIHPCLDTVAPSAIVNASAYTAVDQAEDDERTADAVNHLGVQQLGSWAANHEVPLVHYSTDYVFDGSLGRPYQESDPTDPIGAYGRSKRDGEAALLALGGPCWILRTSWVFSEHGNNFVKTMLRLAASHPELRVVADQRGRPTYAGHLADWALRCLAANEAGNPWPAGVLHVADGEAVSWHEFALSIFTQAHALGVIPEAPLVHPIPTSEFPTPARRPQNSVLDTGLLESLSGQAMSDWRDALREILPRLAV